MNYYRRHIGDYLRDTKHLSLIEHGAYNLLIDLYYIHEKPLTINLKELCRQIRARGAAEQEAVSSVLQEFFWKARRGYKHSTKPTWHHKRVDKEISIYKKWCKNSKLNGLKGGRPKTKEEPRPFLQDNPKKPLSTNHYPLAISQEPVQEKPSRDVGFESLKGSLPLDRGEIDPDYPRLKPEN